MRCLSLVFFLFVFAVAWFSFSPVFWLADFGERIDSWLNNKIECLFKGFYE